MLTRFLWCSPRVVEEGENLGGRQSVHLWHGDGPGLLQAQGAARPETMRPCWWTGPGRAALLGGVGEGILKNLLHLLCFCANQVHLTVFTVR